MSNHPSGKALHVDSRGRLWITSREVDRDGSVAFGLARVELQYVDGFRHRYEAVAAIEEQP